MKYEGYAPADAVQALRDFRPGDLKGGEVVEFIAEYAESINS
ncbi:MAG: hypothetical protein OXE05_05630 [Chloroflexi bacterium]|nr:hypothetical protein [Chloroflexota bacterium]